MSQRGQMVHLHCYGGMDNMDVAAEMNGGELVTSKATPIETLTVNWPSPVLPDFPSYVGIPKRQPRDV